MAPKTLGQTRGVGLADGVILLSAQEVNFDSSVWYEVVHIWYTPGVPPALAGEGFLSRWLAAFLHFDFLMLNSMYRLVSLFGSSFLLSVMLPTGAFAQGVGDNYCTTSSNSVGSGALISANGSTGLIQNDLILRADQLPPGQFGIFFYGPSQISVPFGNGVICVAAGSSGLFRLSPAAFSGGAGVITHNLDISTPPMTSGLIMAGSTWNFQAWYRDPVAGGAMYNFSNGLEVQFSSGADAYGDMVRIPAGSFQMGRHVGHGNANELPRHSVSLDTFYMGVLEITNQQYVDFLTSSMDQGQVSVLYSGAVYQVGSAGEALCDTDSISWKSISNVTWDGSVFGVKSGKADHPVVFVSWYGACVYANWRSRMVGLTPCYNETTWECDYSADGYRLPTEAEWEYAARGGNHSPYQAYPFGDTISGVQANYNGSGDPWDLLGIPETTPAGYYDGNQGPGGVDMANGYGLYDMAGNVWEWCADWYGPYSAGSSVNPRGPATGLQRTGRGGSCIDLTPTLRSARRGFSNPSYWCSRLGMRLVAKQP